jgi:hypothetical protein
MSDVPSNGISIIAPLMGLLLVGATSYAKGLSGDIIDVNGREIKTLASLFGISFLGGGSLLISVVWDVFSDTVFKFYLSIWVIIVVITGFLLTLRIYDDAFGLYQDEDLGGEDMGDLGPD